MEGRSWRGRHGFRPPKCSDRRAADLILPFDTVCHFRSQSQSNLAKAGLQKVLYFQQFSNDNQIRSNGAKGRFMTLDQKVGGFKPLRMHHIINDLRTHPARQNTRVV